MSAPASLHLIARIAGRTVAFPADRIDSAVDLGVITPVPCAAPGVSGLAALRSRVVTVVDPRIVLGIAPAGAAVAAAVASRRAVVARVEGHTYAIQVDALEDVAEFVVQPLPAGLALGNGWAAAGIGLIDRGGEPVLAVEVDALIPTASAVAA